MKRKVYIADFEITKYGGIVEYVASMLKAFRDLDWDADVIQISYSSRSQSSYDRKVKRFETGEHQSSIVFQSQAGGYEKDEVTGYWRNNYYGYFLPPSNCIYAHDPDAVEKFRDKVSDADIILWNFMPTKNSEWQKGGKVFDFWWKFFDLPSSIKQVFLVHDAYFNVRASNVSALKDKILFLGCAHLAAYHCSAEIGIPRTLLLNPRYFPENPKLEIKMMNKRSEDFFAAHMFKSMKRMEDLISAVPYIDGDYGVKIAGTGIEYNYMVSEKKVKPAYMCSSKRDPDLPKSLDGKISMWNRALESGRMEYMGQMSGTDVISTLKDTKFAIDPSWSSHYANYCRTHINGFIIEAMLCGAYPVLRDYRGLEKDKDGEDIYDPLFDAIKAIIVPWNATPKEFGEALREAREGITPAKFLKDTKANFEIAVSLFNATNNAIEIIRIADGGEELVRKELEVGADSENVKRITKEMMDDFFSIPLPIEWEH